MSQVPTSPEPETWVPALVLGEMSGSLRQQPLSSLMQPSLSLVVMIVVVVVVCVSLTQLKVCIFACKSLL